MTIFRMEQFSPLVEVATEMPHDRFGAFDAIFATGLLR